MTDIAGRRGPDDMARQWRSLAERRREHLLSLYRSGRWRKYYSEDRIMAQMRDLVRVINEWDEMGGRASGASREQAPPSARAGPASKPQ